jgi:hypothetical protein
VVFLIKAKLILLFLVFESAGSDVDGGGGRLAYALQDGEKAGKAEKTLPL